MRLPVRSVAHITKSNMTIDETTRKLVEDAYDLGYKNAMRKVKDLLVSTR